MKRVIWKYEMESRDFTVKMPKGAQILSCQMQGELLSIWALVDEAAPKEARRFKSFGTGEKVDISPKKLKFIGTVQATRGLMVHHIFEVL